MKRPRLTPEQKQEIIALSKRVPRITQREIAIRYGCTVDTIRSIQKSAGLKLFPELTPELEKEIVRFLREGNGQHPTARKFRVSLGRVAALMAKHGIVRRRGNQGLPVVKRAQVLERVLRRDDTGRQVAKKESVSRSAVMRIAHAIYGSERFLLKGEPFTSAVNGHSAAETNLIKYADRIFRKHFHVEAQQLQNQQPRDAFVKIIQEYFTLHGVPADADRATLLDEMLEFFVPKGLRADLPVTPWEFEQQRSVFAGYIRAAMDNTFGPVAHWTN